MKSPNDGGGGGWRPPPLSCGLCAEPLQQLACLEMSPFRIQAGAEERVKSRATRAPFHTARATKATSRARFAAMAQDQ